MCRANVWFRDMVQFVLCCVVYAVLIFVYLRTYLTIKDRSNFHLRHDFCLWLGYCAERVLYSLCGAL